MPSDSSETRLGSSPSHPATTGGYEPGTILAERYRIVALAGRGGMGEVYRADDLRLGQPVALKFLPAALEHDAVARDRLAAEVRNARTVSHPNVCRVYDVGELSGLALSPSTGARGSLSIVEGSERSRSGESKGRVFLTMEYIDGEDLASLLRRIGRLPAAKALEIGRQLCAGLAAAHDKGVLHRDLKPANVMIDGRGHARITDFGLAVSATAAGLQSDYSGTLAYMAPERFEGRPATIQSDLYALGLILFETYTGKPAFTARTVGEWQRAHSDSVPSSPAALVNDIEPAVDRAILRCLEKDPKKRPTSAAQVAAALPGGDPLAAAIAAGETPSPELVAASGEEGTLPRVKAWAWFATCLLALAIAFPIASRVSLANMVPLQNPAVLKAKAQSLLRDMGYRDPPADSISWTERNPYVVPDPALPGPADWLHLEDTALSGPILFWYRQSSQSLLTLEAPYSYAVPAPEAGNDACVALDARNTRLVLVRVGGWRARDTEGFWQPPIPPPGVPPPSPNWKYLLTESGIEEASLSPLQTDESPSPYQFDAKAAWKGTSGRFSYRVDGAALLGRPVYFRLAPLVVESNQSRVGQAGPLGESLMQIGSVAVPVIMLVVFVALALLARNNVRLGRGDRKSAWRVALAMLACMAIGWNLDRHWGANPQFLWRVLSQGQGTVLFFSLATWLSYLALEPLVRRRWPEMLVTSTRLLDGRWQDPLVGRSILIGVGAGTAFFAIPALSVLIGQSLRIGTFMPIYQWGWLDGLDRFFGRTAFWVSVATFYCFVVVGVLLTARAVLRRDALAWTAVVIVMFFTVMSIGYAPFNALMVPTTALGCALTFFSLRAGGLLALVTHVTVFSILTAAPLTVDVGKWYVWRSWVVVAVVAVFAFWGFRNVLGKQSAFPAGALDA